ncbi:MAG: sugar transferase [Proteobacteria bacterium]|nr:sugar transferase [Pseudomonadota bacterium]
MKYKPLIRLFSSVGGGPLERMKRTLQADGHQAEMCAALSPEQWRGLFRKGKWGRLAARGLTFGLYPLQALGEALKVSGCDVSGHPLEKPVLVVSTNPFFLPHIMVATKPLHRCAVVPLMYDMYPDALEAAGIQKKWLSHVMTLANHYMLKYADGVVHIGDVMKNNAEKRYGFNPKTWVIPNGASQDEFRSASPALPEELSSWMETRCIFSYVGNMGLMHDVATLEFAVPQFLAQLSEENRSRVGFVIAASGPGEARLRQAWEGKCFDCVRFIGPQPDDAWADLLVRTDVALATLTDMAHATSAPSKIYSAIAAGCIPLAVAPADSDLAHLIDKGNGHESCGIVVTPGDVEGLVQAFETLSQLDIAEALLKIVKSVADENDVSSILARWKACFDAVIEDSTKPWATAAYHGMKRTLDVAAVTAGLAVIWPILLGTAIAVRHHLGTPIFFRQKRPGLDCKPFELLKFRSMTNAPEGTDAKLDGERLSDFGKKIRALSLDELPTLLNVLKGDMSLVGPRPLLMRYIERYNEHQLKRQYAKPGVTGWAQVNGRNAISWEEKFDLDAWYVEHASLWLDLKILCMTAMTVLKRSGISHANSATMPEFMGNASD